MKTCPLTAPTLALGPAMGSARVGPTCRSVRSPDSPLRGESVHWAHAVAASLEDLERAVAVFALRGTPTPQIDCDARRKHDRHCADIAVSKAWTPFTCLWLTVHQVDWNRGGSGWFEHFATHAGVESAPWLV